MGRNLWHYNHCDDADTCATTYMPIRRPNVCQWTHRWHLFCVKAGLSQPDHYYFLPMFPHVMHSFQRIRRKCNQICLGSQSRRNGPNARCSDLGFLLDVYWCGPWDILMGQSWRFHSYRLRRCSVQQISQLQLFFTLRWVAERQWLFY